MKVEDLHKTVFVKRHPFIAITIAEPNWPCAIVFHNESPDEHDRFETKQSALEVAALFRASHVMQQALKRIIELCEETNPTFQNNEILETAQQALALSENTSETI